MAATVVPGQPQRWGNESTNFYYGSHTSAPGVASRQKVYRCPDSQYANSGHFHNGSKALNLNPPLDQYGTPAAHKLRTQDQLVPKALSTSRIYSSIPADPTVNLYQSHRQKYQSYAMGVAFAQHPPSEVLGGDSAVTRALNKTFYTTSYQTDFEKYAKQRSRPNSANSKTPKSCTDLNPTILLSNHTPSLSNPSPFLCDKPTPSLCDNLEVRCLGRRPTRVKSAPPLRQTAYTTPPTTMPHPPTTADSQILTRRRSFTASSQSYPSRGEMLKSIFLAFPAPQAPGTSRRASRPSSAVSLRAGKIPHLRK